MNFTAQGHENILSTHPRTFEFTKQKTLSKRGDCIIGINSDFDYDQLMKFISEKKKTKQNDLLIKIIVDGETWTIKSELNFDFDDKEEIVIRKTPFLSPRTLGINAEYGSVDIPRHIVEKLKNPYCKIEIELK